MATTELQIIRERERFRMTAISRVQWWRLEREGKVPKRIPLGPNSVGWLRHELEQWINARAGERQLAGSAAKANEGLRLGREANDKKRRLASKA